MGPARKMPRQPDVQAAEIEPGRERVGGDIVGAICVLHPMEFSCPYTTD